MIEVTEISEVDYDLIGELTHKIQVQVSEMVKVEDQLVDEAIFGHIQRIVNEEGIKLDVRLNRDFIIEALTNRYENTVKHGKWVNEPPYTTVDGEYLKGQECSVCHAYFVSKGNTPYSNHPYCCECGARMDGE